MIAYPYRKFVLIEGTLFVGDAITSEDDYYTHTELAYTALRGASKEERNEKTDEMVAGWILGDGEIRTARFAAQPDDSEIHAALKDWAQQEGVSLFMEETPPVEGVGLTLSRLLGVHNLSAKEASGLLKLSPQTLSQIRNGRSPRLDTMRTIAEFFQIPIDRLLNGSTEDLLQNELSDVARFRHVEREIQAFREEQR